MRPSDPPDRDQVADAISRFVNDVEWALSEFALLCPERGGGVREDPWLVGDPAFIEWQSERRKDAEASVERARRTGRDLAQNLRRLGLAPEPAIQVLLALKDFSGRYSALAVRWPEMVLQFDGLKELLVVGETTGDLHGADALARQGGMAASCGVQRTKIWRKRALRELLVRDYLVGEERFQEFIKQLLEVGNAGMEGRRLWFYRDAAHAYAAVVFKRRPRRCPKCQALTSCPSCGQCGKCTGARCSCDDAPGLEDDFFG